MRQCEFCHGREAVSDEKYCKHCRKVVLKMLEDEGYLEKKPKKSPSHTEERDRKQLTSWEALGGSAEMNGSGDRW
jgi:hypothetical protein